MARVAILGATSHLARDLIAGWAADSAHDLLLFARRPDGLAPWAGRFPILAYDSFGAERYDAVINFVGIGDPAAKARMGSDIIAVTQQFDEMVLAALRRGPQCRYIFLSSGAAYGGDFAVPADEATPSRFAINALAPADHYGVAKMMAECRHRASADLPIIDIRIFSYFSRTQDLAARFFISDILRAIRDRRALLASDQPMARDYLHPRDLRGLIDCLLAAPEANDVVDAYSLEPIDKPAMLSALRQAFGLEYVLAAAPDVASPSSPMRHYYSLNRRAAGFGYRPGWTSLRCLIEESAALLEAAPCRVPDMA